MAFNSLCVLYISALAVSTNMLSIAGVFSKNNFRPGYRWQDGKIIATYVSTSLEQCIDYCLARSKCLSVEMEFRFHLCRMFSSNALSVGVVIKRYPGIWFSEKRHWNKVTIDTQCLNICSTSETCFINGTTNCVITECDKPPILDNTSVILGNELFVGSKVLHRCREDENITSISICGTDGQWSLQEFICPVFECQDGLVQFAESCYLFPMVQDTFYNAQQYCKNRGARLVHVETDEENLFLRGHLASRPVMDYWIGMTSTYGNNWKWSHTNVAVLYFDWYPGEPDKESEECAVFGDTLSYQWADVTCWSSRNILCEFVA